MKGRAIILAVCERHDVTPDELARPVRGTHIISAARREIIQRLQSAKFSTRNISRLTGFSYSSVQYHLYPAWREKVRRNARKTIERQTSVNQGV